MKFAPYTTAHDALVRKRLISFSLHGHPEFARAVFLAAPAGYGKTTLLCHLKDRVEAAGERTLWLNCTAEDREPDVLLANLNGAFHAAGLTPTVMDQGIAELSETLSRNAPAALLIDEYENASSEGSDTLLLHLIRTLPAECHLFIAIRKLPEIGLTKLLLDGRVRLVDAGELRLTEHEAEEIVGDAPLPAPYMELIEESEGWPVMIQLARLDARTKHAGMASDMPRLGQSVGIFNYLAEQILIKMAPEQRDFLLEISVLSEVDVESAEAVTRHDDVEKRLYELIHLSPIVAVISERPLAIRLHPLMRDFLRHEAARYAVTDPVELNRRAALYYAGVKDLSRSIAHAMETGSDDLAADILEDAGGSLLNISEGHGRVRSLIAKLSPSTIARRPQLQLMRIMQLAVEGASAEWLIEFEHFLKAHRENPGDTSQEMELKIDMVRGIADSTENARCWVEAPWKRIDEIRRKALAYKVEDPRYLGIGLAIELLFITDFGSLSLAERRADQLTELFTTANFASNFSWLSNHQSHVGIAKGDLSRATRYANAGLDRLRDLGETRNTLIRQHCNAILGQCYYEQNQFDLALKHFAMVPRNMGYSINSMLVASVCSQARIRALQGEPEKALADLEDAYAFAAREGLPHFRIISAATIAEFPLGQGDMDGCLAWIARENLEQALEKSKLRFTRPWLETEALVRLFTRLWARQDDLARAHALVHEFAVWARQAERKLMSGRAELLLVDVALEQNKRDVAQAALGRALADTDGTTALRPFFELSEAGRSLLEAARKRKDQPQAEWLKEILQAMEADAEAEDSDAEIISPRQKDVLIGLSRGEPPKIIAQNLDLSYETVRHHLKKIYSKLDVHNREQAVDEARRRSIIS